MNKTNCGVKGMMDKEVKPTLEISARVDSYGPMEDNSWRKKENKRLKSEISLMEKTLKNWDDIKAGKQARASLEAELESKRARLKENTTQKKFKISMA